LIANQLIEDYFFVFMIQELEIGGNGLKMGTHLHRLSKRHDNLRII
jgi:hypothetical protein